MSTRYTIEGSTLQGIANAIRTKNGSAEEYTPAEMIDAINALDLTGGSGGDAGGIDPDALELTVSEDGLVEVKSENEVLKSIQIDSTIESDLQPGCIKEGCNIFGVEGTVTPGYASNFKMLWSSTEPTPEENLIWINASLAPPMTIISADAPASPDYLHGWIKIGTASNVQLQPVDGLPIYINILSCWQWDGTQWNECPGQIYQNGEWIPIQASKVLYDAGMKVNWTPIEYGSSYCDTVNNGTNLYAVVPTGAGSDSSTTQYAGWFTDLITVDDFDTLTVKFSSIQLATGSCAYIFIALLNDPYATTYPYNPTNNTNITTETMESEGFDTSNIAALYASNISGTRENINWTLDVSSLTGAYHIAAYVVKRYDAGRSGRLYLTYASLDKQQ